MLMHFSISHDDAYDTGSFIHAHNRVHTDLLAKLPASYFIVRQKILRQD